MLARAPNKNKDKAEELYSQGLKLIEIARQLGIPEGTVRRWKYTYKWDSEHSDKNSERSSSKPNVRKEEKRVVAEEVRQVIENPALTDKQRLFCLYYVRCFNATKAYQKAYGCSYDVANAEGYKLLVKPCVRDEIIRLKQNRLNREMLEESDIFQKYMDIAFSDITDYLTFGQKEIQYVDKTGEERTAVISYVDLQNSASVDGTILSEVSQGKEGVKIKLADRMKALQWLSDHMDLATEEQKVRMNLIQAQTEQLRGTGNKEELQKLDKVLQEIKGVV